MLIKRPIFRPFNFKPIAPAITNKIIPETRTRKMSSSSVKIEKEAKGLLEHFGENKFVPIGKQTFYCKDSRGDEANFGAPGGDFGEFLLGLDCYNSIKQQPNDSIDVEKVFGKWLDERCSKERPFYLHTDRPAMTRLFEAIGKKGEDIKDPNELNEELQKEFVKEFGSSSNFQGCGHLRLILEEEDSYEINRKLFESLSAAFFKKYFKGDERVQFKIYETIQDGRALSIIYGGLADESSVLATQTVGNDQVFILNQHAVSNYRKRFIVPFFCSLDDGKEKGWRNAMKTANTLAGGKPIYRVDIE